SVVTGQSTISPQYFPRHATSFFDTLYYNTPKHNIKIGGELSFGTTGFESHFFEHGSYTFTTDAVFNNNDAATYPLSFTIRLPGRFTYSSKQIAASAKADWHAADRVRLNLGLRYDVDTTLRMNDIYSETLANPAYAGLKNFISPDRGT